MFKVLSTKLNSEEIDSFNEAAKQQGLSKAGFLRNLVQNYLDSNNDEYSPKDVSLDKDSSPEKFQEPEAFNNISSPPKEHKSLLNKDADGASI